MVQAILILAAFAHEVRNLLFRGTSCPHPRPALKPIAEDALLTGPIEPTNESHAIAEIAGTKLCETYNCQYGESHGIDYRSVMPTYLLGSGDNYLPEDSHVIPRLIRRFHEAKLGKALRLAFWGSGTPRREF
jgi:GDP-L-fucose synthase